MKKLLAMAAAALLASATQAASIAWGNAPTSKLVGLDGITAISSGNATAWGLTLTLMNADGSSTGSSVSSMSMSAGVLSGTAATWTYNYGTDAQNGDEFYIHAIMTVDGTTYEMDIGKDSPFSITATDGRGTDTFTWAAGTYGGLAGTASAGSAGAWSASAVPEPTSGLLMLLGMAGLALRRRRA